MQKIEEAVGSIVDVSLDDEKRKSLKREVSEIIPIVEEQHPEYSFLKVIKPVGGG
jgi:hypothetical protein